MRYLFGFVTFFSQRMCFEEAPPSHSAAGHQEASGGFWPSNCNLQRRMLQSEAAGVLQGMINAETVSPAMAAPATRMDGEARGGERGGRAGRKLNTNLLPLIMDDSLMICSYALLNILCFEYICSTSMLFC